MKTNISTERKEMIMKKFLTPNWTKAFKQTFSYLCFFMLLAVTKNVSAQCEFISCPSQAIVAEAAAGECTVFVDVNTPLTNQGCTVTMNNNLGNFPIGTTVVTFETGDGDICEVTVIVQEFGGAVGSVSCNDYVQVSLNDVCEVQVTPDMVTEGGPYGCMDLFSVEIEGIQGDVITSPGTYSVTVTTPAGNSCWGVLEVEDKLGPVLECDDVYTYCSQSTEPGSAICEYLVEEDDNDGDLSFSVNAVNGDALVKSVEVQLMIETNSPSDLSVVLESAEGTTIDLFEDAGSNAGPDGCQVPNISVTLADDAHFDNIDIESHCGLGVAGVLGSFKPAQSFTLLNGEDPNGTWSIEITNNGNDDFYATGKLIIGSDVGTVSFPLDISAGYELSGPNQYLVDGFGDCGPVVLLYQDAIAPGECTSSIWETIERTWTATDPSGNVSQCVQTIEVERPELAMIGYPKDWDGFEYPPLECWEDFPMDQNGHPDPTHTGFPAFPSGFSCANIQYSYEDLRIDICPTSYKLIRTWSLLDWCTGEVLEDKQIIKVEDDEAPEFACPFEDGFEFFIEGSYDCTTDVTLPEPVLSNPQFECSGYEWEVEYKYFAGHPDDCYEPSDNKYTNNGVKEVNGQLIIEDLPKGCVWVKYIVTDLCGNAWEEVCVIHILDGTSPTAVCIENTVASVGPTGCVKIFATSFDNGSHDNCELESIDVRRMGIGQFTDHVEFCCQDVGSAHMVEFRVTDKAGLTNVCMIEVSVQDKLPPIITCPENRVVDCRDLNLSPAFLGEATYIDNCVNASFRHEDVTTIDQCGVGQIERTFILEADGTNEVLGSCTQLITVVNNNLFSESDIDWPDDLDATECNGSLEPEDLDYPYDYPVIDDNPCSLTAATYDEQVFQFVPGACTKIIRTWTVIDWCQYEEGFPQNDPNQNGVQDGIWSHVQILKLNNEIPPEFTFCATDSLFFAGYGECEQEIETTKSATDDCTLDADLKFSWEVDLYNDDVLDGSYNGVSLNGTGATLKRVLPFGCHKVTWAVEDICGNTTVCEEIICVEDKKKPTPYCFSSITTVVMNNNGQVEIWANDFDLGSTDNCGGVHISFSPDVDSTYAVFDCEDIPNGEEATLTLQMWVTDDSGNQDYCEITLILQDNEGNACDPSEGGRVGVSGLIRTDDNRMVEDVAVNIFAQNAEFGQSMLTQDNGSYAFDEIEMNYDYAVTANKDNDYLNGVSTLDLVLIQKHVLGIEPFESPYKVIAADVDGSESVSAVDLINMRKLILGIIEEFPGGMASWSFVNADQVFSNESYPWPVEYEISLNNINNNMYNQDMIAVKIGDVTDNATTSNYNGEVITEVRSSTSVELMYGTVNDGQIPIYVTGVDAMIGLQLAIDLNGLNVTQLTSDVIAMDESNYVVRGDRLMISWHSVTDIDINENLPLFYIHTNSEQVDYLTIDNDDLSAELYDEAYKVLSIELRSKIQDGLDFEVYQNTPNPFSDMTQIRFTNPKAEVVSLTVTDLHGKQVLRKSQYFDAGEQLINLTADELPSGIMYYTLSTDAHHATKKMIIIK